MAAPEQHCISVYKQNLYACIVTVSEIMHLIRMAWLCLLQRMRSLGIVIIYNEDTYAARLVNYTLDTTTPRESTGAPDHPDSESKSNNYNFLLLVVLVCVLVPLVIVAIVIIIVVAVKVRHVALCCFSHHFHFYRATLC